MGLSLLLSTPIFLGRKCQVAPLISLRGRNNVGVQRSVTFVSNCSTNNSTSTPNRLSGNYQPCLWDDEYLQMLTSNYTFHIDVLGVNQLISELMGLSLLLSTPIFLGRKCQVVSLISLRGRNNVGVQRSVTFVANCSTNNSTSTPNRLSGNYQPCLWDDEYLQLLTSNYTGHDYVRQVEELKGKVTMILYNRKDDQLLNHLELIDNLQRLGVAYHFEAEINNILGNIYMKSENRRERSNLYETALEFRLLRERGYNSSPDVFDSFRDETGNFRLSLSDDIKAMLSLYEASYYRFEGESIMEAAWHFTSKHLRYIVKVIDHMDPNLAIQVRHALELPLHWRMPRLEARWSIDVYEKRADSNPIVLQLAKLDFNILQAMHQEELKDLLRWWKNIGLVEKLSFARNRLVESFVWTVGIAYHPKFGSCRKNLTKSIALITVIDDIYDVYGTLDELEIFTNAVERWDVKAMKQLPDYMKISFLALYNTVNEMAYDILKEQAHDVVLNLKNTWVDLSRSYLLEAKWYRSGYTPCLEEYLRNACISIGTPMLAVQACLFVPNQINQKELEFLESCPDILYWSAVIFRFIDDLATSSEELERGDVAKSIQCYMNEYGISEEYAREQIRNLIRETWKKVNLHRATESPLTQGVTGIILNLVRSAHFFYQHGDGHGSPNNETKKHIMSLLFDSIPL